MMIQTRRSLTFCGVGIATSILIAAGSLRAGEDLVYTDAKGRIRVHPYPVDERFRNPWSEELEDAFWDRANLAIKANAKGGGYGNSFFENEKRMYPMAMFGYVGGFREPALKCLQEEDNKAGDWNAVTDGIDYFPCFTLKGQMRKYFLFGPSLAPAYLERMRSGARKWTAQDPLRRPHPAFKGNGDGWTPEVKNSWVDVRTTDNLQAMRETSVYLMAEEVGNTAVRDLYRQRITDWVVRLYRVGQGEWDSENYHGHTLTAYLNLYDFAKDPGVKLLAKAALDYLSASGAFKYYRGAFNGPSKRDYNHFHAFNGSGGDHMALYFGGYGDPPDSFEVDQIHIITSAYRPPQAVVGLARKEFALPAEFFVAHAPYEALRQGADAPVYFETTYVGHTFQLGTLAQGTCDADVNGFKLAATNARRGAEFFIANATSDPGQLGSAKYGSGQVGRMNVGQYRNMAILLNDPGDSPLLFLTPKSAAMEVQKGVMFIRYEQTWLAVHPVNLDLFGVDAELTDRIKKNSDSEQIIRAKGRGGQVCGFVLEVGEPQTHGGYDAFKGVILGKAKLDLSKAATGTVGYTSALGRELRMAFGKLPSVWRDGKEHDWKMHTDLYRNVDGSDDPIRMAWGSGRLHVAAGGHAFDCTVADDGTVEFTNR